MYGSHWKGQRKAGDRCIPGHHITSFDDVIVCICAIKLLAWLFLQKLVDIQDYLRKYYIYLFMFIFI